VYWRVTKALHSDKYNVPDFAGCILVYTRPAAF